MDVIIVPRAKVEEITALVLGIQGRLDLTTVSDASIKALAQATYDRQQGLREQPDN